MAPLSYDALQVQVVDDTTTAYKYEWTCTAAGNLACVSRLGGAILSPPDVNSVGQANCWPIAAGTLYPGVYSFALTFVDNVDTSPRLSQTRVRVVVAGQAPEVILSTVPLDRPALPHHSGGGQRRGCRCP